MGNAQSKPQAWSAEPPEHHHRGPCSCEPTLAYVRVSRVGSRDVILSPDIQLDAIDADCRRRGKRIVRVISDIDKGGRTFTKRSVGAAIELVRSSVARSITVWKWSRWGRNLEYSLAYLGRTQAAGGRVDSATDDIDQSTATGRFGRDMIMRIDELNSDLIGEGWIAAHDQRREDGLPHSGRSRFGYTYLNRAAVRAGARHDDGDDCEPCARSLPHYVLNADEAPTLAGLYGDYVAGDSLRQMTVRLNAAGFTSPLGGAWTVQALGQMLDTGFGAGWIRERSDERKAELKAAGRTVRNSLASFDVWRVGTQPAVIDEPTWRAYVARRTRQAGLPPRSRVAVHPLSALLFCAVCSRRLSTKYSGRDRKHQWVCGWSASLHPDRQVSVSNGKVLDVVREWIERNAKPVTGRAAVDRVAARALASGGKPTRTAAKIQAAIDRDVKALDRLVMMAARGAVSDDRFDTASAELETSVRALRAELRQTETAARGAAGPAYEAFVSLAASWEPLTTGEPVLMNEALRRVLAFVIVSPSAGRSRWADAAERVEIVGAWEASTKDGWLKARRRRFAA